MDINKEYIEFLKSYSSKIRTISGEYSNHITKLVLTDLISVDQRERKGNIEFPLCLDLIANSVKSISSVDFTFLPDKKMIPNINESEVLLKTIGFNGQNSYYVKNCDILGINIMNYVQLPNFFFLLKLSGIPILKNQRDESHPIIVIGGNIWPNPAPISQFADIVIPGEGEDIFYEIIRIFNENRKSRSLFYEIVSNNTTVFVSDQSNNNYKPYWIDFSSDKYPAGSNIIKDDVGALLLSRGCRYSCTFCNNVVTGGRYRIKKDRQIYEQLQKFKDNKLKFVTIASLVASQYKNNQLNIQTLIKDIVKGGMHVRSLSDRPEAYDKSFLEDYSNVRQKVIIAPESSPRLRKELFHKNITEETIKRSVKICIEAGIKQIQLYVIIGIPEVKHDEVDFLPEGIAGEGKKDLKYIAELADYILSKMILAGIKPNQGKSLVRIDCMPFIPAMGTLLEKMSFSNYQTCHKSIDYLKTFFVNRTQDDIRIDIAIKEFEHFTQAFLDRGNVNSGLIFFEIWNNILKNEEVDMNRIKDTLQSHDIDYDNLFELVKNKD
jgi:radical SAM superfamily enzyme YgiQ (UPF0313 family)